MICPPQPLEVGTEVEVKVELDVVTAVTLPAIVRHCRPVDQGGNAGLTHADPDQVQVAHTYPALPVAAGARVSGPDHVHHGPVHYDLAHPDPARLGPAREGCPSLTGLQFLHVSSDVERHLYQFVGRNQRRLMPRVRALLPLQYRSHGRRQFVDAVAHELSPGDVALLADERHTPGDLLELRFRLGGQEFGFEACAVSCDTTSQEEGKSSRHLVKAWIGDSGDAIEAQYRKALRGLALDRLAAKRD
jgi:hypothetical protein